MDIVVSIGPVTLTQRELATLIFDMQREIPMSEVKIPLIGTFKSIEGIDCVKWIETQLPVESTEAAISVCQHLLELGYLKNVGVRGGGKFVGKEKYLYQWRKTSDDLYAEKVLDADKEYQACENDYR